jgi:hypothetical protein
VKLEGRLLRLAESYGVKRDDFLRELLRLTSSNPAWEGTIGANLTASGWRRIRPPRGRYASTICAARSQNARDRDRPRDRRIPAHRA